MMLYARNSIKVFQLQVLGPDQVSKRNTVMVVNYMVYHDNVTNYTGPLISAATITEGENCHPRRNINCEE